MKLCRIGFDGQRSRMQRHAQFDVFPYQSAQKGLNIQHHSVEIQNLWRRDLAAAEGEQLPHENGPPFRRTADVFERSPVR